MRINKHLLSRGLRATCNTTASTIEHTTITARVLKHKTRTFFVYLQRTRTMARTLLVPSYGWQPWAREETVGPVVQQVSVSLDCLI